MSSSKLRENVTDRSTVKRITAVAVVFSVFLLYLLLNLLKLQLFKHEYYVKKTYEEITTSTLLRAERGKIYDSTLTSLAEDRTEWRVFVSPKEIRLAEKNGRSGCTKEIAQGLSKILELNEAKTEEKIRSSGQLDLTLKKSINKTKYEAVIKFIINNSLENLVFTEAQTSRYYPEGTLAAHALGFCGSENSGLFGLEYYYNETLSGKDGYYLYAKNAGGITLPTRYSETVDPIDGASIVTTIDSYLQSKLETQLEAIRINHNVNNRVTGIVMDTSTGAILAMATSSPFDPNDPFTLDEESQKKLKKSGYEEASEEYKSYKSTLLQEMWSNKAVTQLYEPGSTFKIVTVGAALDSGSSKISDLFSCKGYHEVGGWRIKCHKVTGHGSGFDLAYGLQMSCNPTMMKISEKMGVEVFYDYVKRFGYFEKTGIDLPGEAQTIFHEKDAIGPTELATASFGQRFKVSVIGQLAAVSSVANGGKLVKPYLVERVVDRYGNTVSEHKTEYRGQSVSETTAKLLSGVLEDGVSGEGGAKNARVIGYSVAAKTGTSQKFDILDENGNSYLRISSTVAFTDGYEKNISMIIVADEPMSTVKYGSVVAAPYISAFLEDALPYLEYASTEKETDYEVKSFVGMNASTAANELSSDGVAYKIIGNGKSVLSQMPRGGDVVTKELATIYLYTEDEDLEEDTMPTLIGLTAYEANIRAASLGLNLRIIGLYNLSDGNLKVIGQSIPAGDKIRKGQVLILRLATFEFED